eukprot:Gb_18387 [translate_table: standard]
MGPFASLANPSFRCAQDAFPREFGRELVDRSFQQEDPINELTSKLARKRILSAAKGRVCQRASCWCFSQPLLLPPTKALECSGGRVKNEEKDILMIPQLGERTNPIQIH